MGVTFEGPAGWTAPISGDQACRGRKSQGGSVHAHVYDEGMVARGLVLLSLVLRRSQCLVLSGSNGQRVKVWVFVQEALP